MYIRFIVVLAAVFGNNKYKIATKRVFNIEIIIEIFLEILHEILHVKFLFKIQLNRLVTFLVIKIFLPLSMAIYY